jgi:hypothetical protein
VRTRRDFILAFGGTAAAWPLAARAQQTQMRRVGLLLPYEQGDPEAQARNAAIQGVLKDLGWAVGRNVRIDLRWGGNDTERSRTPAAETAAC